MPNVLNTNPLYFDTAGASSEITTSVNITSIVWDSSTTGTVADVVLLHDASGGNVVWQCTLAVAKDVVIWTPAKPLNVEAGLYLTTLSDGILLVYIA